MNGMVNLNEAEWKCISELEPGNCVKIEISNVFHTGIVGKKNSQNGTEVLVLDPGQPSIRNLSSKKCLHLKGSVNTRVDLGAQMQKAGNREYKPGDLVVNGGGIFLLVNDPNPVQSENTKSFELKGFTTEFVEREGILLEGWDIVLDQGKGSEPKTLFKSQKSVN